MATSIGKKNIKKAAKFPKTTSGKMERVRVSVGKWEEDSMEFECRRSKEFISGCKKKKQGTKEEKRQGMSCRRNKTTSAKFTEKKGINDPKRSC